MKTYNIITKSNYNRLLNNAFMKLYNRLLDGSNSKMEPNEIITINSALEHEGTKAELKL